MCDPATIAVLVAHQVLFRSTRNALQTLFEHQVSRQAVLSNSHVAVLTTILAELEYGGAAVRRPTAARNRRCDVPHVRCPSGTRALVQP